MSSKHIHLIAAARPNFMKIAPLYHALAAAPWANVSVIHTGQHYDLNMSDIFFRDLGLHEPEHNLGIGSAPHGEQTGLVMTRYERLLFQERPDFVVVPGDVNSTMGCALAAVKLGVKVAHLEAGLRSFDRTMPEEINRIVTDAISDVLWTPSPDADANLIQEGIPDSRIERIGNIMIDTLEMLRSSIEADDACQHLGLANRDYVLVTLHRPSNVDNPDTLRRICQSLGAIARTTTVCFPVHPRTAARLKALALDTDLQRHGVRLIEPLGYTSFMNLVFRAAAILTDSGGVQEESTHLGVPCLTLRANTERPITMTHGTNRLITPDEIVESVQNAVDGNISPHPPIPLWDGRAAQRATASLHQRLFR